jgi:hypothetical protein
VQVASAEGAIGKRRIAGGRAQSTYLLDVGDRTFKVSRATCDAAPDAGLVRLYFLPRSRKIVNLERLPNPPLPKEVTAQGIVHSLSTAFVGTRSQRNEARAEMAGLGDALKASFAGEQAAPPSGARDPRALEKAIVGTWTNGLMNVTFSAAGTVTIHMLGRKRDGHWSVDGGGRLCADITGRQQAADAWIDGNQLTIAADGTGLTFTREASG